MALTRKIISGLKDLSEDSRIREKEKYVSGYAKFSVLYFDTVVENLRKLIDPIVANGEKIESNIGPGEIIDSGIKQFYIEKGIFIELYDFEKTTATFIRLYHIKDNGEWLALYIDENPCTPWWDEE
jgi:hypothetical protein